MPVRGDPLPRRVQQRIIRLSIFECEIVRPMALVCVHGHHRHLHAPPCAWERITVANGRFATAVATQDRASSADAVAKGCMAERATRKFPKIRRKRSAARWLL